MPAINARQPKRGAKELATRIAQARRVAGLTQRDLAARLGVTPGAIGQWEVGIKAPSRANLTYLAQVLGTPVDLLLGSATADPGHEAAADQHQLLREARDLGIDLGRVVAEARRRRWLDENRGAIEDANAYLERRGLWSDGKRLF